MLFAGSAALQELLVTTVADAGDGVAPSPRRSPGAGIGVFRIAVERWVDAAAEQSLPRIVRDSFDELKTALAATQ